MVAIGAGAASTWLLVRVEQSGAGRRLGRRALWLLSIAATAALHLGPPDWFRGGAPILSWILLMTLAIAGSVAHHRMGSSMLVYQVEMAVTWWAWFALSSLIRQRLTLGGVVGVTIFWLLFAFFGALALYHRRPKPADES